MQLLAADDFTHNSHALTYLSGEVSISMKTGILQIRGYQTCFWLSTHLPKAKDPPRQKSDRMGPSSHTKEYAVVHKNPNSRPLRVLERETFGS